MVIVVAPLKGMFDIMNGEVNALVATKVCSQFSSHDWTSVLHPSLSWVLNHCAVEFSLHVTVLHLLS